MYIYLQGFSTGKNAREFAFDNVQLYADGSITSDFVEEFEPSISIDITDTLRMHAGSKISVCLNFSVIIRKTCPCNVYPLMPHFYVEKLGYAGVYLFFLFLLQNIDCGYSL